MSSNRFVVGINDNGRPYEVVHIEYCGRAQQIGVRRRFFVDFEEARAAAKEHRAATCCKRRIEEQLGRQVP